MPGSPITQSDYARRLAALLAQPIGAVWLLRKLRTLISSVLTYLGLRCRHGCVVWETFIWAQYHVELVEIRLKKSINDSLDWRSLYRVL